MPDLNLRVSGRKQKRRSNVRNNFIRIFRHRADPFPIGVAAEVFPFDIVVFHTVKRDHVS